jgi:6-phosphofructokinase 1
MNIVVLTSGGDAPGMNACVHHITKLLTQFGKHQVYASPYGFKGLLEANFMPLTVEQTREYKKRAGSFFKSSRCLEFRTEKGVQKAVDNLAKAGMDVVIVLGGDGSYKGCVELMKKGVKVIFIPATIDRDMHYDTYTIGFFTATSACCHYIHNVKDTMHAFDRVCVYEIMGRNNPSLTKLVGEIVDADLVIHRDNFGKTDYKEFAKKHKLNPVRTVLLQENLIPIDQMVQKIIDVTGGDVRSCVIGYVQRGTPPTKDELKYAQMFASQAVKAINNKKFGIALAIDEIGPKIFKIS